MLLVIFGAVSSYDSVPAYPPGRPETHYDGDPANKYHRPPLANELFENRPLFAKLIDRFSECQPIVPRLRALNGASLEGVLQEFQEQASAYPRGHRQLAAVRYYLQAAISLTQGSWNGVGQGVTNYKTLIDPIEHVHPRGP